MLPVVKSISYSPPLARRSFRSGRPISPPIVADHFLGRGSCRISDALIFRFIQIVKVVGRTFCFPALFPAKTWNDYFAAILFNLDNGPRGSFLEHLNSSVRLALRCTNDK